MRWFASQRFSSSQWSPAPSLGAEPDQGRRAREPAEELLGAGRERVALGERRQSRAPDVAGAALEGVRRSRRQPAAKVGGPVDPEPSLDDLPAQAGIRVDRGHHRRLVRVGDLGQRGRGLLGQPQVAGELRHPVEHAPPRRVEDAGGEAMLPGRRAGGEVAAEAPPLEHDLVGVDVVALQRRASTTGGRRPAPSPGPSPRRRAPASSPGRGRRRGRSGSPRRHASIALGEVHVGHRRVVAVRADHDRTLLAARRRRRRGGSTRASCGRRTGSTAALPAGRASAIARSNAFVKPVEGLAQPRVDRRAVEDVDAHLVERRRAHVVTAGVRGVAGLLVPDRPRATCRRRPSIQADTNASSSGDVNDAAIAVTSPDGPPAGPSRPSGQLANSSWSGSSNSFIGASWSWCRAGYPNDMRVVASPEAVAFVRERGGRLFMWPQTDGAAAASCTRLESSTEPEGEPRVPPGARRGLRALPSRAHAGAGGARDRPASLSAPSRPGLLERLRLDRLTAARS